MFSLATPLGLLGLSALALPLWLHLVRRPARTVRVASLRFLPKDRVPLKAVHVQDPWLFLLRCLLIVLLVLLLSGLRWRPEEAPAGRWRVLHPRAELTAAETSQWDIARREGFADWPGPWPVERSAWSFFSDLDRRVGPGSELVVFGPTEGRDAPSLRPRLHHLRIRWVATPARSVVAPRSVVPDRVALLVGPDRGTDARYVRAALEAVAEASGGRVEVVSNAPTTVIALGDVGLPAAWRPQRLWVDRSEDARVLPVVRGLPTADRVYALRRRTPPGPGATMLADSAGEALLTLRTDGGVERWTWAGRFHPEWTEWVSAAAFARSWGDWLLREPWAGLADGTQPLSVAQLLPRFEEGAPGVGEPPTRDLRLPVWWLIVGLFLLERGLGWRRRKGRSPEAPR